MPAPKYSQGKAMKAPRQVTGHTYLQVQYVLKHTETCSGTPDIVSGLSLNHCILSPLLLHTYEKQNQTPRAALQGLAPASSICQDQTLQCLQEKSPPKRCYWLAYCSATVSTLLSNRQLILIIYMFLVALPEQLSIGTNMYHFSLLVSSVLLLSHEEKHFLSVISTFIRFPLTFTSQSPSPFSHRAPS